MAKAVLHIMLITIDNIYRLILGLLMTIGMSQERAKAAVPMVIILIIKSSVILSIILLILAVLFA